VTIRPRPMRISTPRDWGAPAPSPLRILPAREGGAATSPDVVRACVVGPEGFERLRLNDIRDGATPRSHLPSVCSEHLAAADHSHFRSSFGRKARDLSRGRGARARAHRPTRADRLVRPRPERQPERHRGGIGATLDRH
jgi:hypothetical protein